MPLLYDLAPLHTLTKLQHLAFSAGHLYPSAASLSVFTSLTTLNVHLPDIAVSYLCSSLIPVGLKMAESTQYNLTVNAHTALFSLTALTGLTLNGHSVQSMQGIQVLPHL